MCVLYIHVLHHFLHLLFVIFNVAWVFMFMFMQKLSQEHKLEKRDEKVENRG